jgi:hypothetical protein
LLLKIFIFAIMWTFLSMCMYYFICRNHHRSGVNIAADTQTKCMHCYSIIIILSFQHQFQYGLHRIIHSTDHRLINQPLCSVLIQSYSMVMCMLLICILFLHRLCCNNFCSNINQKLPFN